MKKIKLMILSLALMFVFSISCDSQGGLFKDSVPTGKEIKESYLEKLFAPEFPFESIKVIETNEGKRYVVIKAKEKVSDEIRLNYEKSTLRNRGIVVFRSGSPRTNVLLISEMRFYRKVSEMPYIVEYSEVKGDIIEFDRKRKVESVVRNEGKYLIVLINKDFGKVFKRVEIYPENDAKCPEPPYVGKYPNSRTILCIEKNKGFTFIYTSRDKAEVIYNYFKNKLKAHYKKVGFNLPEKAWDYSELGMKIDSYVTEAGDYGVYLEKEKEKGKSVKSLPPPTGVIFNIRIVKGGAKSFIQDYTFITVYYSVNQEELRKNIDVYKKLYPEGVEQ
ncbi:MAG: hypothetical protein AB1632_14920 [Nitrospirota bacterium]